jgi:hypothetical protein
VFVTDIIYQPFQTSAVKETFEFTTQRICLFPAILTVITDYVSKQHQSTGIYTLDARRSV